MSSAFSNIVVFAQELLPGRVGMVAGLFFGLAFVVSGAFLFIYVFVRAAYKSMDLHVPDPTELLEMGLNLPQATQLVRALRDRGIAIERDYFRMDELAQDLIGRWKHDR